MKEEATRRVVGLPAYKLVDGEAVYAKVISFPPGADSPYGGESMWVLVQSGDENNGTGWVDNNPVVTDAAVRGSLIEFGGGTDEFKPHYIRTLEMYTGKFGGPTN